VGAAEYVRGAGACICPVRGVFNCAEHSNGNMKISTPKLGAIND
jgi:hypothetical protein